MCYLVGMVGVMLAVYVALIALTGWRLTATPAGFIPAQDQGNVIAAISLPAGASLERTDKVTQEVTEVALRSPGVYAASAYAGVDATSGVTQSSSGQIYLVLDPFESRLKRGQWS